MVFGGLCYTISSIFVKFASQATAQHHAASLEVIIFFRFAVLFAVLLCFSLYKPSVWKTEHKKVHFIRGLCGLLSISCFFYSLSFIPLAIATLFASCTPLFVPLVLRVTRGVRIIPQLYWGFAIGIIGVMLILHPNAHGVRVASLIALLSAVFRASSFSFIRHLGKTDSPVTTVLYYFLMGTALSGVAVIISRSSFISLPWFDLLVIGVLGAVYQVTMVTAARFASARALAPIVYVNVVFAAIADWFIWGQSLSLLAVSGIVTVFVGAMVSIYFSNKLIS
jgi:drug/metabolite transporter (DMT)-like permease